MNILFIVIGSFLILLGGIIWRFSLLEIVAGYNEENILDKKGLARWVGINYILMGLLIDANSLLNIYFKEISDLITMIIFTVILYSFFSLIAFGGKKYKKE